MIALEEIRELPLHEKLRLMETLWEGITSSHQSELVAPGWHQDLLDEREQLIREGKATFIDWETAKEQIKNSVS